MLQNEEQYLLGWNFIIQIQVYFFDLEILYKTYFFSKCSARKFQNIILILKFPKWKQELDFNFKNQREVDL